MMRSNNLSLTPRRVGLPRKPTRLQRALTVTPWGGRAPANDSGSEDAPPEHLAYPVATPGVLDRLPLPAWLLTPSGELVRKNTMCANLPRCQTAGGTPCAPERRTEQGCGRTAAQPDPAWQDLIAKVVKTGDAQEVESSLGNCGTWRMILFPVLNATGKLEVGGLALNTTSLATERRRTQETLAQLRTLAQDFDHIREHERADIARDIHDKLGQELTVLRLKFARLQQEILGAAPSPGHLTDQFEALSRQMDLVIRESRAITCDLRIEPVDVDGLAIASSNLVLDFRRRVGIRGQLELDSGWANPPKTMARHLYRSLQECLNNMAKHSRASKFHARLSRHDSVFCLEVMDNGCGIPYEFLNPAGTLTRQGLRGLAERAAICGGSVTITTRPHVEGTLIRIDLPLGEDA